MDKSYNPLRKFLKKTGKKRKVDSSPYEHMGAEIEEYRQVDKQEREEDELLDSLKSIVKKNNELINKSEDLGDKEESERYQKLNDDVKSKIEKIIKKRMLKNQ
jgi:hypothetical protein